MTPLQATELVYETIRTGWSATDAVGRENEPFTPPRDAASIHVQVLDLEGATTSHGPPGARIKRHKARILATVYVPRAVSEGVGMAKDLAGQFAGLFELRDLPAAPGADPLHLDEATPTNGRRDGDLYRLTVRINFTFDQVI